MIDTTQIATEIRHLIKAGTTATELLVKVARKFSELTSAELSEALQDATAQAERQAARRSISSTDTPLADIAVACGFSSQAHMTTVFRKRLGITPALLRA